jgi:catechol 2,3-dioxygenase-like lactoylglutathione lyase family enzyme
VLACPDLDAAIDFYAALGFRRTYRQVRPNPYAVVVREDMEIHLCGIDGYDPQASVGSVIVVVPDAHALHASFVAGLREQRGRVPSAGIPRVLRPRRKQGTTTGFTVVDTGGNWLRFFGRAEIAADAQDERSDGLARVLEVAARQGDAHGDEARAIEVLDRGLGRHRGARAADRARVLLYRAELLARTGDLAAARGTLAEVDALPLSAEDAAVLAEEIAHAREVLAAVTEEAP